MIACVIYPPRLVDGSGRAIPGFSNVYPERAWFGISALEARLRDQIAGAFGTWPSVN